MELNIRLILLMDFNQILKMSSHFSKTVQSKVILSPVQCFHGYCTQAKRWKYMAKVQDECFQLLAANAPKATKFN